MRDGMSNEESSQTKVVLGSDNRLASAIANVLEDAGYSVDVVADYEEAARLWQRERHHLVLLEISHHQSLERAVNIALRVKQQDATQFVGYLTDRNLHTSSLAGDVVLPRDAASLTLALKTLRALTFSGARG